MELNQGNLTLDKGPAVPRKTSSLSKTSVSIIEESSQMVLWTSLLWMVSLSALEQLKLHWKGELEVLKHAQSSAGDWQEKKRQSPL